MNLTPTVFEALNFVTDITLRNYASDLVLICSNFSLSVKYSVTFLNCTSLVFDTSYKNTVVIESNGVADIIRLDLGEQDYKKKAVIHTDLFEVSILYRDFDIQQIQ